MTDERPKPRDVGGRPSKFDPRFVEQAEKLTKLGATSVEVADFFDVHVRTIERWASQNEKFCRALKAGKDIADDRVERSLYHRAIGYSYDAVKIFNASGTALVVPYQEHVPPDTSAAIFWLKNRRPDEWRDRQAVELTGKDGGPVETADVSDRERAKALLAVLARADKMTPNE